MAETTIQQDYEKVLLGWLRTKVGEGLSALKKERAYTDIDKAIAFVEGKQPSLRPKALSSITDNRLKKILLETVSALTDVRPIWNYETYVEEFKAQSEILNKLARGWWKNSWVDRRLQSTLSFAGVGGSGYVALVWNPELPGGGDLELIPYDPRDVIPIDPVFGDSIQEWRGVVLRQRMPVSTLKSMYPAKAHIIGTQKTSWFGPTHQSEGGPLSIATAMWSVLTRPMERGPAAADTVDRILAFFKDDSLHTGIEPRLMGDPNSNWSYMVYPVGSLHPDGHVVTREEAKLYPRGRLVICTPDAILRDIPNPYWHGMFPVVRFTLDPLPWSLLGSPMIADLIPLQNALNESLRGMEDGMGLWIRRGIVADARSISRTNLEAVDTRKSGFKAHLGAAGGTEGFKIVDGPSFPNWYMEFPQFLKNELDELSGVRGLQQLAQMKQMPSADAMEKYMEALSPMLRLRARSIEVSLGELAEMLKVCFFQYYDVGRRMQILGQDGMTLEDFDYDPNTMVPGPIGLGDPSTRNDRAQKHHRNFTFSIAPNTLLTMSNTTQKMMIMQLLRANLMDPWTAWEAFDLANVGKAPAETIPERMVKARELGLQPGPTPEMVQLQQMQVQMQLMQMQQQMQMIQAQQAGALPAQALAAGVIGPGGPGGPQPNTSGVGPQGGHPPSGGQPPQFVQKDGGARTVVSESGA